VGGDPMSAVNRRDRPGVATSGPQSGIVPVSPRSATPSQAPGPSTRRVTVALHAVEPPVGAITLARGVARALGASLHGLFSWPAPLGPGEVVRLLRVHEEHLRGMVLDVVVGDHVERIGESAGDEGSEFLIVTAESPRATAPPVTTPDEDPLLVGRLVMRALEKAHHGVFVVRPDHEVQPVLRRILLPLDGTPSTAAAIGPAGELAQRMGAALDIVFVGETGPAHPHACEEPERGSMRPPQYDDQPHHEWPAFSHEFLARFLQTLGHCPPDVPTRLFLGIGEPSDEILRFANELAADLVVLVWHGHLEAEHGHVFRRVLPLAPCPVLVLRR
jgi:nucleotide-binding universal stress UspA family protein